MTKHILKQGTPKLLILRILICLPFTGLHADVTSWRNEAEGKFLEANSPIDWNNQLAWKTPLESTSNASPILVKGKLYFTSEPANLVCADSETGEILWTKPNGYLDLLDLTQAQLEEVKSAAAKVQQLDTQIAKTWNDYQRIRRRSRDNNTEDNPDVLAAMQAKEDDVHVLEAERHELEQDPNVGKVMLPQAHATNGYSSYSPISDGERIYVAFGLGVVVAYDLEGNRLWHVLLDKPDHHFGGSTMPMLIDDKLVVRFTDYVALDKDTGAELWRAPSGVVFGTPAQFKIEDQSYFFTLLGQVIRAADGKVMQEGLMPFNPGDELWYVFNTPVVENGIIYSVYGDNVGFVAAFKVPEKIEDMDTVGLEALWRTEIGRASYYASPIVHNGLMYIISSWRTLSVLEASSGELVYEEGITGLRGKAYASLSLSGQHLVFGSDEGTIVVVEQGRYYKEVSRCQVGPFRSTPIFEGNTAYIRTFEHLQAYRKMEGNL